MQNLETKTVREIALEMPVSTRIFEEFHIDYCCGGRKPFAEACSLAGVEPDEVADRLRELEQGASGSATDFERMPLAGLIDHILEKHHVYTKDEMRQLAPLMEKVAGRHGESHTELLILKSLVLTLFQDLASHMAKEEAILFPYLRELLGRQGAISSSSPAFGTVRNPLRVMMAEHDRAGELLRKMRENTDGYTLPAEACPSYTALYTRLEELEKDLHQHIHLENNILFPKALELEAKVYPLAAV
ncbi:MAG: iron-sulfur cluster repair di-iron protein [Acidobacteriota bacterium]|nr:MAG: iron-sulfur cluster repair di-iron protein [Acidobacteriota bacterium]